MKSILIGTICDILCVFYLIFVLLIALGVPLVVFVFSALIMHWFVLLLVPFIWVVPSLIVTWIEENIPMTWVFKNSHCFYECAS